MPSKYLITDHVREEFRNLPEYRSALSILEEMLENEENINVFCIHEAGHITYFLKSGFSETDFVYQGPTIYWDVGFRIFPAAVGKPKSTPQNVLELESFAKISVAGGVFESELAGSISPGDKDDRERFHNAYAILMHQGIHPKDSEQAVWNSAVNLVRQEFKAFDHAEIRKITQDVRIRCFRQSL